MPRPTKPGHKQGQGSAPATAAAGTSPATVHAGTAPAPAPERAPASTLAAPTDSEMTPEGEQATAPDSGTVAPAVTTTEVRGVTAGLATMAVAGPSTAPPAAPSATPVAPAAPVANTVGQELQSVVVAAVTSANDRTSYGSLYTGFSGDDNPTICL